MAGHSKGFGRWRTWTQRREGLAQGQGRCSRAQCLCGNHKFIPHLPAEELQKRLPLWAEELLKGCFSSGLMQSSARTLRLEGRMRLEFGFQPKGGAWKFWEVGGGR